MRRGSTSISVTRLLAAGLLAAVAAACGGDGDGAAAPGRSADPDRLTAAQVVRAAATETADQGTARMSLTMKLTGGTDATVTGDGAFDLVKQTGVMTMDMGALTQGQRMEMRLLPGLLYMKAPPQLQQLLDGKTWLRIDLEALGRQAGVDLGQLQSLSTNDPRQALTYLEAASDDVTSVGTEQVRGAATTHYRGTLDFDKAAAQQPALKEVLAKAKQQLGTSRLPFDVWIADDGTLRRMTYAATIQNTQLHLTMELFDYGTRVVVAPPPSSQVAEFADLMNGSRRPASS